MRVALGGPAREMPGKVHETPFGVTALTGLKRTGADRVGSSCMRRKISQIEGVVSSLGLLYTTFAQGQDSVMVPNTVVLSAAVVPLREPAVDLRARLRPEVRPSAVQELLEDAVRTPVRGEPRIALEELDSDEVVVRVSATPVEDRDGPRLADEILAGLAAVTREDEHQRVVAATGAEA